MKGAETIVVGGGILGATTLWELAREGMGPLLLEAGRFGEAGTGKSAAIVGRKLAVTLGICIGAEDVLVGGDEESSRTTGRIQDSFAFLWSQDGDNEINDVTGGAELPGITLRAQNR